MFKMNFYIQIGLHIHALSGILIGLSAKFAYKILETRRYNNDLVIWDYVRHHKQDFPEVFNGI